MPQHLFVHPWTCVLCDFPLDLELRILIVSDNGQLTLRHHPCNCPKETCLDCKTAPIRAFPFHKICCDVLAACTPVTNRRLRDLGRALAARVPLVGPPARDQDALKSLTESFSQQTLANITTVTGPHVPHSGGCACTACLIGRLSTLPNEILALHIAPLVSPSAFQHIIPTLGETIAVFGGLGTFPARNFTLSCRGRVFESRVRFRGTSYITSLHHRRFRGSRQIKSRNSTCESVVVWLDEIGITDVEFLPSSTSPPSVSRKKGRWAYAVAVGENPIHVESKGVFLNWIDNSPAKVHPRIHWDCSPREPLFTTPTFGYIGMPIPPEDFFLHYVPLHNISGISVAMRGWRLQAIVPHDDRTSVASGYEKAEDRATWFYCPLHESETILEVWWAHFASQDGDIAGLMVKTTRKQMWLGCHHLLLAYREGMVQLEQVASGPNVALYYSSPNQRGNRVIGAIPPPLGQASEPEQPRCRTGIDRHFSPSADMVYSEAPLAGVVQVQRCIDKGGCIGLLLHYSDISRTVGAVRLDKLAPPVHHPEEIGYGEGWSAEAFGYQILIDFHTAGDRNNEAKAYEWRPMRGIIVWWCGDYKSQLLIVDE